MDDRGISEIYIKTRRLRPAAEAVQDDIIPHTVLESLGRRLNALSSLPPRLGKCRRCIRGGKKTLIATLGLSDPSDCQDDVGYSLKK